ncbi:hypothetical protein LK09_02555 [Microbacterium mangrovi]|uniref:FHA domain-containing protein n=1 Tax=Microbacterium mangrovi TaxID=1348253 RepID=A0A0B2A7P2_9MICO|nr:DUF5684 domain-containing protein [Microbacterium mangrovi]KHK99529.1 hypothetical protein LK09_02555 [Microbacterium mangrovi]
MGSYNTGADTGLIVVAVIVDILLVAGVYVWTALSLNAVFRKTGEPGWAGWVPYFNTATVLKLGGFSPFLVLIVLFPVLGPLALWVLVIISASRINVAFGFREGAGVGMTFLAALLFPVWSSVLGWGSARWVGPDPRLRAAAIGAAPGSGYEPAAYGAPAGFPQSAEDAPAAPAPSWLSQPPAAPAASQGDAPSWMSPPPAAPAAPDGYAPPATEDPFAPLYAAPEDDDLEGIDDPVPGPRRSVAGAETTAQPAVASHPTAGLIDAVPVAASTPGPAPATEEDEASAPVAAAEPAPAVPASPADPWAPPAPVSAARRSPAPEPADFSDTSAEVSAVAGAPMAGVPMSARSSVSARRAEPELPDAEGAFDETIIAPRRRTEWMLTLPLGAPIRLTSPVLILGRRPAADPAYPQAQLVDIADETRTVSKTHARLELAADSWTITDLGSTNGVVLIADDGTETDLPAGASQLVGERFLLGDAELRLTRGKE